MKKRSFASDNYGGVLPEMLEAIWNVNKMHVKAYGHDEITIDAKDQFKKVFDSDVDVSFVFNGTGANVLSLSLFTNSFNAILCADSSHLYMDESTAPESFTGCRLMPLKTNNDGKIDIETIKKSIIRRGDEHFAQIKVLSIAQPTEYGTVYSLEELTEIGKLLKEEHIIFHMDGARLFNAAIHLNCSLSEMTKDVGVDVLSVGGTKIGMMFGEAVVCFNKSGSDNLKYKHKQSMQLPSKMRFISAQFYQLLKDKVWVKSATHSNKMAIRLYNGIKHLSNIEITRTVQANSVFAAIPVEWNDALLNLSPFYIWDEHTNEVRWMCAFDTEEKDIDAFIELIKKLNQQHTKLRK